ncbi:MAG: hypothetical protein NXY57DRAFT_888171, partial [Lentinula lateritia]
MTAASIHNIAQSLPSGSNRDVILPYDSDPIVEYNNPDLFPGMFPTLFPLGIGGFEDKRRCPVISLEAHVEYLLDQSSREFRYHHFFSFVALNLIQRRKAHLHTSLWMSSTQFSVVAPDLIRVSPSVLFDLAEKLKNENNNNDFSSDELHAFQLLNQVNIISSKIPGSQASKTVTRNQIRSFYSYFGLPHLFLTLNPSAVHSPIFQVMYGESNVDLSERYPYVVHPRSERACRVAKDPVAAADFFDFMYHMIFEHLFGWDFKSGKSCKDGGLFGHLRAFFGCAE